MKKWTRNISPLLKRELERLEAGNQTQRKRCDQTFLAIARVLQNPNLSLYKKSELEGHCAVDIGQQYRLFFFIEHEYDIVNFVWMNSEEHIHTTSGVADYCYDHFKKLLRENAFERYVPVKSEEKFEVKGSLRTDEYVQFLLKNNLGTAFSSAQIRLAEDSEILDAVESGTRVYAINFLSAKPDSHDLKKILLGGMCSEADEYEVCYSYRSARHEHDFEEMRELLFTFGFEILNDSEGDEIIYLRHHR